MHIGVALSTMQQDRLLVFQCTIMTNYLFKYVGSGCMIATSILQVIYATIFISV